MTCVGPQGTPPLNTPITRYRSHPSRPCALRQAGCLQRSPHITHAHVNVNTGTALPAPREFPQDNYLLFIVISIFINYSYDP